MRLSDHLNKAFWSFADRSVFLGYGFVGIAQVFALPPEQWGVFLFFDLLYNTFFTLSDGFVLQALVKFGVDEDRRAEVMTVTFLAHTVFITALAVGGWALRGWLAHGFHEARYLDVLTALPLLCLLTVPRTYALKLFQMMLRTRDIFFVDLAFFGTMTVMTIYRVSTGTLNTAETMIGINMTGAIAGTVVGIVLAIPHLKFRWVRNAGGLLKEMIPFSFFQGAAVVSTVIQQRADETMVQYFWSTQEYAVYGTAKRFFKVFEAARDAIGIMVYPATARLQFQKRFEDLRVVIEKMMSFAFIGMIPVVLFCWLGGTNTVFHLVFGNKYDASIPVFNILAFAGLLLPFTLNLTVLTGLGRSKTILQLVAISSVVSLVGNYILVPQWHALGAAMAVVIAAAVTGTLATIAVNRDVPVSLKTLFRGIPDGLAFIRQRGK